MELSQLKIIIVLEYYRSNAPKEIIVYPDNPEIHGENRSFVTRETILQYIQNFTDHFDLRKYIQVNF